MVTPNSGPSFGPKHVVFKLNCLYKEYLLRTRKPMGVDQNDVIKNLAVAMSVIIKRVDCIMIRLHFIYL